MYSRKEVQRLLSEQVVLVWCKFGEFDKYGRPLVTVYDTGSRIELAGELVKEGLANAYFGGTKEKF